MTSAALRPPAEADPITEPLGTPLASDYAETGIDPYAALEVGDRVNLPISGRDRLGTIAEICDPYWGGEIRVVLDRAKPWDDGSPEQPRCLSRFDAHHIRLIQPPSAP